MIRVILTFLTLLGLWLLMSGVYKELIIWLGVGSALVATLVTRRMDKIADDDALEVSLKPVAFVGYIGWLLVEIAKANWAVTKTIMSPDLPVRQHFFKVPFRQKTDLCQTIFANSITLTPGTVSVEVEDDFFWVHAISYSEDDMDALAEMDARVLRTERS